MRRVLVLLCLLVSLGCTRKESDTVFLVFNETEPNGLPYPVRMLVTDQFLRIEDGDGKSGYILFDRAARKIYSVNNEARVTLVLEARPIQLAAPKKFEHRDVRDAEKYPDVAGKTVVHHRLMTNGENCFEVYAAADLLPQAVAALREYHETLASEQAVLQDSVPAEFQSVCDLADYVFLPARHLAYGFPVRQVNRAGVIRQLTDFKTGVPIEAKLLELPKDYEQVAPAELRGKLR